MDVHWLTFGLLVLIQLVGLVYYLAVIKTKVTSNDADIQSLREWRHKAAPKEMIYDSHIDAIKDHELRLRVLEHLMTGGSKQP